MTLKPHAAGGGTIERTANGWRLRIPSGSSTGYRLAQLDDYMGLRRSGYAWRAPATLTLQARASIDATTGTWGFGFWNDPYGFSVGTGSQFLRLPALPQSAWFFAASKNSHLSFRDEMPGNGLMAQAFRSPRFDARLIQVGLTFPFSPKTTRQLLSRVIDEDAALVTSDPRTWRTYRIEWEPDRVVFHVDGQLLLESQVSPRAPLGVVVWIDNQYAAFEPSGRLRWGVEVTPEEAWLEIADIQIVHPDQAYGPLGSGAG
jgi:hypothetical protein